jgi:hypothetical protein
MLGIAINRLVDAVTFWQLESQSPCILRITKLMIIVPTGIETDSRIWLRTLPVGYREHVLRMYDAAIESVKSHIFLFIIVL